MANECQVFEMRAPRNREAPIRTVPFLAKQLLDAGGDLSAAFNKSTTMITIIASQNGTVDFTATDGTAPTGSLAPFPILADTPYDFDVRPGTQVYFT